MTNIKHDRKIKMINISDLQHRVGDTNKANGFHEDGDLLREDVRAARLGGHTGYIQSAEKALNNYYVVKMALVMTEVAEAIEEIRSGHAIDHEYIGEKDKPEGPMVELADALIRILGIAAEAEVDLGDVVARKLAHNATRGYKHGGRAF